MFLGAAAEAIGWRFVATGRAVVWRLMPVVLAVMGVAAILALHPVAATKVADGTALAVGLASGLLLYVATGVFVVIASRWEPFRRHVAETYQDAAGVSLAVSLVLSLAVMVPAEECFWRGLFQARLDQ